MPRNNSSATRTNSEKKKKEMMTGTKVAPRLSINIPESARAEVDALVAMSGRSITDLVRFGLSLVKVVLNEHKAGNKLIVTTSEGKPLKELIVPGF